MRTDLACTTPGCRYKFKLAIDQPTRGNVSYRLPVELLTLPDGDQVVLEDYECNEAEAVHFCKLFQETLHRIPTAAREAIMAHWQTGRGSPHVWLLNDRREWRGSGWAATRNRGLSLCIVSTLIGQIPDEHIRTAIAHEFGHTLFIAVNERYHTQPTTAEDAKFRQEWLVWRLMEVWGFDQPSMEEWMERNMIDDANSIRLRDPPQKDAEFEGKCIADRAFHEDRLRDMAFPAELDKYRGR